MGYKCCAVDFDVFSILTYYYYYAIIYYYSLIFPGLRAQQCKNATLLTGRSVTI